MIQIQRKLKEIKTFIRRNEDMCGSGIPRDIGILFGGSSGYTDVFENIRNKIDSSGENLEESTLMELKWYFKIETQSSSMWWDAYNDCKNEVESFKHTWNEGFGRVSLKAESHGRGICSSFICN